MKYADDGRITVGITRTDRETARGEITVSDEGPGIPSLDRDAVFTAFFR